LKVKQVCGIVLFALLVITTGAKAQLADSIKASFHKKPKLSFRWDSHGSFITNTPARMTALGLGVRLGNYVRVGWAINWLNTPIYRKKIINTGPESIDTVNAQLNYGLLSLYANVVVGHVKKWEFTVPFEVGFGSSSYTYFDKANKKQEFAKGGIITLEPMLMTEYKVFKWLGVGAGLGLRLVPINNRAMKENFNSLLWDANVSIYFGEIYKGIVKGIKKRKEEKKDGK